MFWVFILKLVNNLEFFQKIYMRRHNASHWSTLTYDYNIYIFKHLVIRISVRVFLFRRITMKKNVAGIRWMWLLNLIFAYNEWSLANNIITL